MSWRRYFHRAERDAEIARDIGFHLDTETEDNIARGMSPEQARAAALRKFGNTIYIREEVHLMNSLGVIENLWRDLLYALRGMRKNLTLAATAVLTLALGIGGNTAMFSVIRAVLLEPLAYSEPDRLVAVSVDNARLNRKDRPLTPTRFGEMQKTVQSFGGFGAFHSLTEDINLSVDGDPEALKLARVSANFLDILGLQPALGRSFVAEEDTRGGPLVAMISFRLWQRRFGGDPQVIGRAVPFNSTPYTIIGVLRPGFDFPMPGVDVWVTRPWESFWLHPNFWPHVTSLIAFGRLKPEVSLEQARSELSVLNERYVNAHPERLDSKPGATLRVTRLKDRLVANVRPLLLLLFGAVGFVLLIACANAANLLLARATTRSREFAVRSSLGAGRLRLVRQLLAESLALSALGGAAGLLLGHWGLKAIIGMTALDLPLAGEIELNTAVLGFSVALSLATGTLSGLLPSIQVSRPQLAAVLRESGAAAGLGHPGGRGSFRPRVRDLLVVGQVALSIVLLVGAALLMQSMARLRGVALGFQPSDLLTMKIALPTSRYDTKEKKAAFFNELVSRLEATPDVRSATVAKSLPTTFSMFTNVQHEGDSEPDVGKWPVARLQSVTPGYFRTLGIPVQRGRAFTERDAGPDARPAVIISEAFARHHWPDYPRGVDPVGQKMREGADRTDWMPIVGIVGNVVQSSLASEIQPEFYVTPAVHASQAAYVVVRSDRDPTRLVNSVRSQVLAVDPQQPVAEIRTMDEILEASLGHRELMMWLLGLFAGIALLLAVVGIYGAVAYAVAQRTHEVGIRRALGAQQGDILRLMLGQGLRLALGGVAIGIGGALALTRVMDGMLFEISATDPMTYAGIAFFFLLVALLASFVPARRAARIDPMAAWRLG